MRLKGSNLISNLIPGEAANLYRVSDQTLALRARDQPANCSLAERCGLTSRHSGSPSPEHKQAEQRSKDQIASPWEPQGAAAFREY